MRTRCLHCQTVYSIYECTWRQGKGRFCSRRCAAAHAVGPNARRWIDGRFAHRQCTCKRCGRSFQGKASSKFCSIACARRARTMLTCVVCGKVFYCGHLSQRCCSVACGNQMKRVEVRKPRMQPSAAARRAQSRVAYLISVGKLTRPRFCEQCGREGRIEAAHFDYRDFAHVRWLCTSCHRYWDRSSPKGGAVSAQTLPEEKAPPAEQAEAGGNS